MLALEPEPVESGSRWVSVVAAALVAAALTGCVPQAGTSASDETDAPSPDLAQRAGAHGDEELLELIRPSFTADHAQVAVAFIDGDEVRAAYLGADADTVFELGSITKTATGMLLAEGIERGEVALGDPVGTHVALGDSPAASVTFAQLSAHTSGLPMFPTDPDWLERVEPGFRAGEDVLDESVAELLAQAAAEPVAADARPAYSNLGAALAGQALAAAAGTDFATLLEQRILSPLGMDRSILQVDDADVAPGLATGHLPDGRVAQPSTLAAYSPAGALAAPLGDVVEYARAVLDGPLASSAALEPRADVNGRSGYFWVLRESPEGHRIAQHGGVTAGFGSVLVIDRTAESAVIVLSNTGEPIDDVGDSLLAHLG
ncbi:serine hydrolase domain-containing protein [Agromyces agglutinans]|nr:serine hydrolase domain-containing protein [Agromyces agglutinans]